ncbi:MAG TPA: hypothetical protein VM733_10310 [Thermoanaerobaculia bacterium]|nr:hypothetical protein [Thermoanaerobaculia bacterium]
MKKISLLLTVLVVLAQPAFGRCISCLNDGNCGKGDTTKCVPTIDGCISSGWCQIAAAAPLAGEYRIASVEITHGTDARVAEVKSAKRIAQVRR